MSKSEGNSWTVLFWQNLYVVKVFEALHIVTNLFWEISVDLFLLKDKDLVLSVVCLCFEVSLFHCSVATVALKHILCASSLDSATWSQCCSLRCKAGYGDHETSEPQLSIFWNQQDSVHWMQWDLVQVQFHFSLQKTWNISSYKEGK